MVPAQPPLPTARNLPFQFSAGSHSSISMCESEDGVSVTATRQWAGSSVPAPPRPRPVVDAPAATDSTAVIVARVRESAFSGSQAGCCSIAAAAMTTRELTIARLLSVCCGLLLDRRQTGRFERNLERQPDVLLREARHRGTRAREVVQVGHLALVVERVLARKTVKRRRHPP